MINVAVKDTNEVLGFPDTMSIDDIHKAIDFDRNGTISQVKPNWYNDKVRPALEASGLDMFQPKFLGATVDPDATRAFTTNYAKEAFGFENKNPEVKNINLEASSLHPIASFTGSLAGQVQAIMQTAGLGELLGFGKIAETATKAGGEVAGKVAGASAIGGLYGAIKSSREEIDRSIEENTHPDVIKIGYDAMDNAGVFGLYGLSGAVKSIPIATSAVAGTAYALSKAEGHSDQDSLLNAAVMGIFHLSSSGLTDKATDTKLIDTLDNIKATYIKAKNPIIDDAIATRSAQEHTMAIKDELGVGVTEKDIINKQAEEILNTKPIENPIVPEIKNNPELDQFKTNLNDLVIGNSEEAHIANIPKNIAQERNIPQEVFIKKDTIDKIRNKHELGVDEKFIENLNSADSMVFPENDTSKINFIKKLDSGESIVIGTKRFNGHYVITGFHAGDEAYISSVKKRGEVLDLREGGGSSISPPLEGGMPASLSGVNKSTSPTVESIPLQEGSVKTDTKISGLSQSVENSAIKEGLVKDLGNLPSYEARNMDEIAGKVSDFINKDYELAKEIALGEAPEQDGLRAQELFTGLKVKAEAEGDVNTLRDLALSDKASAMATELGQRVKALDSRSEDSPIEAIKEVKKAREDAVAKKSKSKDSETQKKSIVKEIKKEIKKNAPTKETWASFIDSIQC